MDSGETQEQYLIDIVIEELLILLPTIKDDYRSEYNDTEPCMDVRLQLLGETFLVHAGSPQFDTDHHGYWGSGILYQADTLKDLVELATELVDQALEDKAMEEA